MAMCRYLMRIRTMLRFHATSRNNLRLRPQYQRLHSNKRNRGEATGSTPLEADRHGRTHRPLCRIAAPKVHRFVALKLHVKTFVKLSDPHPVVTNSRLACPGGAISCSYKRSIRSPSEFFSSAALRRKRKTTEEKELF